MESEINKHYAKKVKDLREKSNQIQKDVAVKLKMKQQNYSKLENGETNFSDVILMKICNIFNITPSEFILDHSPLPQSNTIKPIVNNVDDFTTRIFFKQYRRQLIEQQIRIAELEAEVLQYRSNYIIGEDGPPIYVII